MKSTSHGHGVLRAAALLLATSAVLAADDRFSEWAPASNLGPPVNTAAAEVAAALSKDGRALYFTCLDFPGGLGGFDLWVSTRPNPSAPWGPPQNLGPTVNSA